jgi:hypothetical protein
VVGMGFRQAMPSQSLTSTRSCRDPGAALYCAVYG